jgi:hypothetical protein
MFFRARVGACAETEIFYFLENPNKHLEKPNKLLGKTANF